MYACEMARDGDAHYDIITTFLQTVITTSLSEQFTRGLLTKWLLIAAPRRPPWHLEHVSIVSLPALWARSSDWPLIISCSGWLQRVAGQHGAAMTSHYVVQDCRLRGGNRAYWSKVGRFLKVVLFSRGSLHRITSSANNALVIDH